MLDCETQPRVLSVLSRTVAKVDSIGFEVITDWQQFLTLDYDKMANLMNQPVIIDGRNFLNQAKLEASGFRYVGVGR